jgi:hypothetical protein
LNPGAIVEPKLNGVLEEDVEPVFDVKKPAPNVPADAPPNAPDDVPPNGDAVVVAAPKPNNGFAAVDGNTELAVDS